ncbi:MULTISPECIES: cytoplasmic protein [Geobacillus]|jgi:hypothetical protein|uniref:Cytoplasmic protein n=1 Tax=Geobacillus thermodenitrificans TaxID=33940 RepID=A0ABY9QBB9_GEOTD|nr:MULTISPECIES: cytoplasmic protein [Geobacillus]ARP44442.1 hypothetical protein GTHT12_02948 [Geobacillus thermodenitrificans]ATO37578.1 cytoplasmic protein [Geobacillus thermodenitrificans]MEC5188189.1 hypothetical protein [Geobacillus thermodenitrificans]OQP08850.1 cytoplasmic protein [Geobacillus sp. 47C-IIb]PJW19985.1 cytoplasmic protein [Geobacillus thermodenitrificans]
MQQDVRAAHRFSAHNRKYLQNDALCGCFHCLAIFSPGEITEWVDQGDTALCPYCGIDSVIGEGSGFPIARSFLKRMRQEWF